MRRDNHTHFGTGGCQGNGCTIIERSRHPTFRMRTHLTRSACEHLLNRLHLQQVIRTTSGNHSKTRSHNVEEWSSVTIEPIETEQHRGEGKRKVGSIGGDHLNGTPQFAPVISIA